MERDYGKDIGKAEQWYDKVLRISLNRFYFPDREIDKEDLSSIIDWLESAVERELSQNLSAVNNQNQSVLTGYHDQTGREYVAELVEKLRTGHDLEEGERLRLFSWITGFAEKEIPEAQ